MQKQPIYSSPQKQAPTFLFVLCILSFVMVFTGVIYYGYLSFYVYLGSILTDPRYESINQNTFWLTGHAYVSLLFEFISLAGVILMFKLKKQGFIIYVIAETVPAILGLISVYSLMSDFHHSSGLFSLLIGRSVIGNSLVLIIDLIFIYLYSTTLKYMR